MDTTKKVQQHLRNFFSEYNKEAYTLNFYILRTAFIIIIIALQEFYFTNAGNHKARQIKKYID